MAYSGAMTDMAKQLILHLSEADFQNDTVIPMALWGGWSVAHTSDSRRIIPDRKTGGTKVIGDSKIKGYPDLTLVHPTVPAVVIAELKREHGWEWRDGQKDWLDRWAAVSQVQEDWRVAAERLPGFRADLLGPAPRVYAALWRPGDVDQIEEVLIRHRFDTATWWPDYRR